MRIELFDAKQHERKGFDSGNPALNEYLQKYLAQGVKKHLIRAYVALEDSGRLIGYYTLSAASISCADLPPDMAKGLPCYPIPALLIGRMATDTQAREQGLKVGSKLLIHACKQVLKVADTAGVLCVVVDAKPEAVSFYERFGFMRLKQEDNLRLYLPVATLQGLLGTGEPS
ncbi:GNAT family N-acetyltransferase [Thiofilum flexile]|uniref:GNAT family N-acetyltransferase n=1 Tax=Thiofilum flexile TaxID=125627 RepID=UPI000360026F|nr:GNAT family N-acetyltransferase [Thiofilum flexile]